MTAGPLDEGTRRLLSSLETDKSLEWVSSGTEPFGVAEWLGGDAQASWIFDHIPKTGGTTFAGLCEMALLQLDHLQVAWPGSWAGITLGRLARASVVHGHGARHAARLQPERPWRRAVSVRDPIDVVVSQFQQVVRFRRRKATVTAFKSWYQEECLRIEPLFAFNTQAAWMATERYPTLTPPYFRESAVEADKSELLDVALAYVEGCSLISDPAGVGSLFLRLIGESGLGLPPVNLDVHLNVSSRKSRDFFDALPAMWQERIMQATEVDRVVWTHAQSLPTFVGESSEPRPRPGSATPADPSRTSGA